jgi:hypothetical protein
MARKDKMSPLGKIALRVGAGIVFSTAIYMATMLAMEAGMGAVVSNVNDMAAISRYCNDFAASKAKDVNEKNQIGAQCIREKLAANKK